MKGPFANAVRLQAQRVAAEKMVSLIGSITSYDPNKYAAKVQLQPDGIFTGWLPIASIWIGSVWGLYTPPNIGDLCAVEFINGDLSAGVIVGRFWNNQQQPLVVQSGECWLVHANGQSIKLTNDGQLTITDGQGATAVLDGNGNIVTQANNWNHTGTFNLKGDANVTGKVAATGDVTAGSISLTNHVHSGVQTGGGVTGPAQG